LDFTQYSPNNNKARFEDHLANTSNVVLYGHEHDSGKRKNVFQDGTNVLFSEGKAFQKVPEKDTGFSYLEIDIDSLSSSCKTYNIEIDKYICNKKDSFELIHKEKREFVLKEEFEKKLNRLNIPLKHSKKSNLFLSDVFVFPDLEPIKEAERVVQYQNSEELVYLLKTAESQKVFIEGEDQSGKTTLFFVLYRKLYEAGLTPVYVRGKYTSVTDLKPLIKKALKEQYNVSDTDLFFQQKKRVLMLDNLHKSPLNTKYRPNLIKNINTHFDYVIVSSDNSVGANLPSEESTSLKEFDIYKLLPLGHEKRSELIEKWMRIGENPMTIQEDVLLKNLTARYNEINSLLGNRLMPSYPIFILTLLQSLDAQILPQDYSATGYAHCYHALITAGLMRLGLKEEISSYFNILKELSFYLYNADNGFINESDFIDFYNKYKKTYYSEYSPEQILINLVNANILKFDDEYYSFSYKYIYFYLIADRISARIEEHESIIEDLCSNIHLERNANILIFLSHHSKTQVLIEQIVFASLLPFENYNPITLDKGDSFSTFITEFVKEIQQDVIEDRDPKKQVKQELQRKDEFERISNNGNSEISEDEESNLPPEAIELSQAFRIIKILGQIVKNQKGAFEKSKLEELVESAYNTCFRFIGFYSNILERDKELFVETISDELKDKVNIDKRLIEKKVLNFLQFISWRICIDSFTNLMFSVGTNGRNELFDVVANKIDSSAAKIVTYAIKSYYGSINIPELKAIFKETEGNYMAQSILKVYVKKHLYTNIVDNRKRDQIIKIAGFKPGSIMPRKKK
jgi:hypothetical protein